MNTLYQDIKQQSKWIIKSFASENQTLDYTITSFIEIDLFFNKYTINGKAKRGGLLSPTAGPIIFALGAYVGETIIKTIPGSKWVTDDSTSEGEITASVVLPNAVEIFPVQRLIKRFQNGNADSVYIYGHEITKDFTEASFNEMYWEMIKENKPWWKFW